MIEIATASDGAVILYDPAVLGKIDSNFFEPEYWRGRNALTGSATGRGTAWFVNAGTELVLRHYRRGGCIAPLLVDRYLWTGLERTRAVRELRLLYELFRRQLPVPRPVAVRVQRAGLYYRADLLTQRIPDVESLADALTKRALSAPMWRAIGTCVRRFHLQGVYHADLNAHNILLAGQRVYLIDFDRGHLKASERAQSRNITRLKRSLDKLSRQRPGFHFAETNWSALMSAYAARRPAE
jgi:3-deoxy-D-manno-octulosonic acid kinase